jgi:hypothetical protein
VARLIGTPSPIHTEKVDIVLPEGHSVREHIKSAQIALRGRYDEAIDFGAVWVDDKFIDLEYWDTYIPPANSTIYYRAIIPTGGDSNKLLNTVLTIAIIAASIYVPGAMGLTGATAAFAGAAIAVGGTLLINALVPIRPPRIGSVAEQGSSPTFFITSARNEVRQFGVIPVVLGKHIIYPPFAALPFTEMEGDTQFFRAMFILLGDYILSDFKIGETSISDFDNVDLEIREPDDTGPLDIYPNIVFEESLDILLNTGASPEGDDWQTRTTQPDTDEFSVDFTFPGGLFSLNSEGIRQPVTVLIELEFSDVTVSPTEQSVGAGGKSISAQTMVIPDVASIFRDQGDDNDVEFITARTYTLAINRYSGELELFRGKRTRVDFTSGTSIIRNDEVIWISQQEPINNSVPPVIPDRVVPLANIVRFSDQPNITAADITDTRPSDAPFEDLSIDFQVSLDSGDTVAIESGTITFAGFSITSKQNTPLRRGITVKLPQRGQYDVRVKRVTPVSPLDTVIDEVRWTALRSFNFDDPLTIDPSVPVTRIALRIEATDRLNGVLDRFNFVAELLAPALIDGTWTDGIATRNPAALAKYVLQSSLRAEPLPDSRIHFPSFEAFYRYCADEAFTFNMPIDFDIDVWDLFNDILAAGRASWSIVDGKWAVVIDNEKTVQAQHFNEETSFDFEGELTFEKVPEALSVTFIDQDDGYRTNQQVVYRDFFDATNATEILGIEYPGITDSRVIWQKARYDLAVMEQRKELFSFSADIENLICSKFDLIRLSHLVPGIGLGGGRVKSVRLNTGDEVDQVTLNKNVTMVAGSTYTIRFRKKDNTTLLVSIITSAGDTDTLDFTTPVDIADAPEEGDSWSFGETDRETIELIVRNIEARSREEGRIFAFPAAPAIHDADIFPVTFDSSNVDIATDSFIIPGNQFIDGYRVHFREDTGSPQALPSPFVVGTKYFVVNTQDSAESFSLALTKGGGALNITDVGVGTHTIEKLSDPFDNLLTAIPNIPTPVIDSADIISDERALLRDADGSFKIRMIVPIKAISESRKEISHIQTKIRETDEILPKYSILASQPIDTRVFIFDDVEQGVEYEFAFRYISIDGEPGNWSPLLTHTVIGKSSRPADVTGLTITPIDFKTELKWAAVSDLDLDHYEIRRVDGSPTDWESATFIDTVKGTSFSTDLLITGFVEYMVKAVDTSKNKSLNPAIANFTVVPPSVNDLVATFQNEELELRWNTNNGTYKVKHYEIARGGTTFETATLVAVANTTHFNEPADWGGTEKWWVRAVDIADNAGAAVSIDSVIISPSITFFNAKVIDNNVLLSWGFTLGSLPIARYDIRRGSVFATAELIGIVDVTFETVSEFEAGVYTYWVQPIDSAGNVGTERAVTTTVDEPPDFILRDQFKSDFIGVSTNMLRLTNQRISLDYDGVDDHVDSDSHIDLNLGSSYPQRTIEVIFETKDDVTSRQIIWKEGGGTAGFGIYIDSGSIYFGAWRNSGIDFDLFPTYSGLLENTIYKVAMVFDVTGSPGELLTYVGMENEEIQLNSTTSIPNNLVMPAHTAAPAIGYTRTGLRLHTGSASGANTHYAKLRIDELKVWNLVRDLTEIRTDLNSEPDPNTGDLSPPELVLYFRFNELSGLIANDLAVNELDGTIVGASWFDPFSEAVVPIQEETWQDHFNNRSWSTPQDQIDAGFPIYIQPSVETASIEEYYDIGSVIPSSRIIVDLVTTEISGSIDIDPVISVKTNAGDSFTQVNQAGAFDGVGSNFRYIKVQLNFSHVGSPTGDEVLQLNQMTTTVRIKVKTDNGAIQVNSNPTVVNFNISFLDVSTITLTPEANDLSPPEELTAVLDFDDVSNPTSFSIHLFDRNGQPATGRVHWIARGF